MNAIPVEGHSGLVRDKQSGAIININKEEILSMRAKKAARKKKEEELESLKNQVGTLKDELSEIKELLQGLVNGNN